jgi:hypothetical protein
MLEKNKTERIGECSIGVPIYSDLSEAQINDPSVVQDGNAWWGSNEISFKLLRCLEGIRDLSKSLDTLSRLDNPNTDKRLVKQIASPLYNLASGIMDMFNDLESNVKQYTEITSLQHKEIIKRKKQFVLDVPIDKKSDLRLVRDKIDSHIDKIAVIQPEDFWIKVELSSFLRFIVNCLKQFVYLLSLDVYSWRRENKNPDIWSYMSIDGILVDFYLQNGKPVSIISANCVASPKNGVVNEINALIKLYNEVASKCEGINLIKILVKPPVS